MGAKTQPVFRRACRQALSEPASGVGPAARGRAVLATPLPDREALDDEHAAALAAPTEAQLIASRQTVREEDGVFE